MKLYNELLDETIIYDVLQNGLKYYIIPKNGYTEKRALLTVKYGSADREFKLRSESYKAPEGTAHFLEHKLFDNETGSAFDEFSKLGAYVNAYTSFNNTAYYFSCADKFSDCLKRLLSFVSQPFFTAESIAKEVGIIEREISMYNDNPGWAGYFSMLSCLYENHPAKDSIAGTKESVREIKEDTLYTCHKSFYVPSNMYLICAGGFDGKEIAEIREAAAELACGEKRAETLLSAERETVFHPESSLKMNVSRPVFQIGFKDRRFENQTERACAFKIGFDLLVGESSELKERLINERLSDDSLSFDYVYGDKYGYVVVSGESSNPRGLLERCVEQSRKAVKNGFGDKDFERIKRKHVGRFIKGMNSLEAITAASAEYAIKGANLFDCLDAYKKTEIDDCVELIDECFRENGFAFSIVEPE